MAGQGGRRSKGPRTQFTLRVPEDHGAEYLAAAEAAGFTRINDYLAYKLAEAHGLAFSNSAGDQQRLALDAGRDTVMSGTRATSAA